MIGLMAQFLLQFLAPRDVGQARHEAGR
jgi:hypothetical protein